MNRVDSLLWRACSRGLGPTDPRFGSRKLWPISWVLPPAAACCCRCFRRWCGCRGHVGRTGLQTSMRTGRPVALKTTSKNRRHNISNNTPATPSSLWTPALIANEDNRNERRTARHWVVNLTLRIVKHVVVRRQNSTSDCKGIVLQLKSNSNNPDAHV